MLARGASATAGDNLAGLVDLVSGVPLVTRRPLGASEDGYRRRMFGESRDDLLILPEDVRGPLADMQYRGWCRQIAADHPAAAHEALVADGTDAGLLVLDQDAERVHVVDIVVTREQRRRGIGSSAMRLVIAEAGNRIVTLLVWSGNVAAWSLYERLGFVVTTTIGEGHLRMEHRPVEGGSGR